MTLTTFGMESAAYAQATANGIRAKLGKDTDFINKYLPKDFPGRITKIKNVRSAYSLGNTIHAEIFFDDFGLEKIEVQVPLITEVIDVFDYLVNRVYERLAKLKRLKSLIKPDEYEEGV